MIASRLTLAAEQSSARYGLLIDSFQSLFNRALNEPDFGSSTQRARLISQAYQNAETFLTEEALVGERLLSEFALEARTATLSQLSSIEASELAPSALEHLYATQSYLNTELIAQVQRDIALLRQSLQQAAFSVGVRSRVSGQSERLSLINHRIDNRQQLSFVFYDRRGRQWSSKKFVRGLWRHTMLSTYNEIVLLTLADHGISRAQVEHVDTGADVHGLVLHFDGETEPQYSERRDTIFHPNANAILAMERLDVSA